MKRLLATLVCISALSSVFGQDYQLGTGVSKTNNSIPVVYQVRNSGTEGAGVLLLSANDSIAIIAKGDTLSLAHPDTAVDFFLLTEGDILNRGDYKYWDGDSWELFTGGSGTLDEAYDFGGAGAGREIVADAGAVEIVGTDGNYAINTTGDVILHSESDSTGIFLGQYDFEAFGSVPVSINGSGTYEWLTDWVFLNYTGVDNLNESVGATMLGFSATTGDYRNIRLDSLGISIISGNLLNGSIASITLPASQPVISVGLKTSESAFVVNDSIGGINMIAEEGGNIGIGTSTPDTTLHVVGKMKYEDGTQGDGYVLTSDADGMATWTDAATLDFSAVPSYADNTAAEAVLGAGKLYYTDVAGEYMLKVTH